MPFGSLANLPIFGRRREPRADVPPGGSEKHERNSAPMTHAVDAAPSQQERDVLQALSTIQDPDLHRDIVALGFIKDLQIQPTGAVSFAIELTTPACPVKDQMLEMGKSVVGALPWVTEVSVEMRAQTVSGRRAA